MYFYIKNANTTKKDGNDISISVFFINYIN